MAELLASKIVIEEVPPSLRSIPSLPTAIGAVLCVTEKGPVLTPRLITSFDEFVSVYGTYIAASKATAVIEQAFNNGLKQLYVSRVVHYTDITDAGTKISAAAHVDLDDAGAVNVLDVDGLYDGTYANGPANMQIVVAAATSGVATEFNLSVVRGGVTVETFPNLVNDGTSTNDAATVINATGASEFIKATFVVSGRPVDGTFNLTGGDDGLTGLADTDYSGSQAGGTGVFAFDTVQNIRVLFAPDRLTSAVQNAIIDYCEITRTGSCFAVVTVPEGLDRDGVVTFVETTANLLGKSEFGAVYWPHVKVSNPSTTAFGSASEIVLPNTGHVVGTYARTDAARDGGVYDEPAGVERGILRGVVGLETNEVLKEVTRDVIYPKRINPITTFPGVPIFIDGSRTLKGDSNFPSVAQRRGVINIEQSIQAGLQVFRFNPNDEDTRAAVEASIDAFLLGQFQLRAFRGKTPAESFFTDVSEELNTPVVISQNKLIVKIGLATQRPIEFIILRFSQDLRDVEAELASV